MRLQCEFSSTAFIPLPPSWVVRPPCIIDFNVLRPVNMQHTIERSSIGYMLTLAIQCLAAGTGTGKRFIGHLQLAAAIVASFPR